MKVTTTIDIKKGSRAGTNRESREMVTRNVVVDAETETDQTDLTISHATKGTKATMKTEGPITTIVATTTKVKTITVMAAKTTDREESLGNTSTGTRLTIDQIIGCITRRTRTFSCA